VRDLSRESAQDPLAAARAIRYNPVMIARRLAMSGLLLIALALGGCTKCGWLWDNQGHACHSDQVK